MSGYLSYETRGDKEAPTLSAVFKFIKLMQWQDFENFCAYIEFHRGGGRKKLRPEHVLSAYDTLVKMARPAPVANTEKTVEQQHGELTK